MFHWKGNIFFGRRTDGSVRLLKFADLQARAYWPQADDPLHADAVIDETIPAAEWASIIASVRKGGETPAAYQLAEDFHAGDEGGAGVG